VKEIICKELQLTVTHDGKYLRVHLEDPLQMTEAEVSHEMNVTTLASRAYHVKEAMVIAVRQVIAQGWELGMFKVDLTKLPVPPSPGGPG
jgi:hypothetical protein